MKMTKTGIFLLLLVSFTYGLKLNHDQLLPPKWVYIKGANGDYLKYCKDCVKPGLDTAVAVKKSVTSTDSLWFIQHAEASQSTKYRIYSQSSGGFLQQCEKCWPNSTYPYGVIVSRSESQYTLWEAEKGPNGKFLFKGPTGLYLGLCSGCFGSQFYVFEGDINYIEDPFFHWTIEQTEYWPDH